MVWYFLAGVVLGAVVAGLLLVGFVLLVRYAGD